MKKLFFILKIWIDFFCDSEWNKIEGAVLEMPEHRASHLEAFIVGHTGLELNTYYNDRMPQDSNSHLEAYFIMKTIASEAEVREKLNLPYGKLESVPNAVSVEEYMNIVKNRKMASLWTKLFV